MEIYKKFQKCINENRYFIHDEDLRFEIGDEAFKREIDEHFDTLYKLLDGYIKEMNDYLDKNHNELKNGHLIYLCDVFLVKNDVLKRKPYILVPLGMKVLDYINARDENLYDRIYHEKTEAIRDYIFTADY